MTKILIFLVMILIIAGGGYWMFTRGVITPTSKPVNSQVTEIKNRGKLIVATDATYPPLEFLNDKKEFVGFDIDLAAEIAKEMGISLEMKNVAFDDIFGALEKGEADLVISSITITTERQKQMLFSTPYLNAGQVVVVKTGSPIKDVNALDGKRVGVQTGTTSEVQAKIYTEPEKVVSYKDYIVAQKDLLDGKIDAVIIDYPAGISMSQDSGGEIVVIGNPFTSEFYGVVAPLGKEGLIDFVNNTIVKLKSNGRLTEIERLWFKR